MTYTVIQPPFTLKFAEMPKKELKDYFEWFHGVLPERLNELTKAVKESPQFESWEADFTASSLDTLGAWFVSQVETRPRTTEEQKEIKSSSPYPIEIPNYELTNRTFSLAFDVGMYLSQVFIKNHSSVTWGQVFGNKHFVDYGQPVLLGFGSVPFNPVRMLVTLAYGVASKGNGEGKLRELYGTWAAMITPA